MIAPGTPLAKKPPRWVVAAELVETSRLFARTVARIDPETVEKLADHLVKRQYSEPRWDAKRGSVVATERVTLYGLPLVVGRRVQYGSIDPVVSRELFIRHALVQGEWTTHHRFWADNAARDRAGRRARGAGPPPRHPRSTTRRCSSSTTRASPPTSSPPGTSTAGGRPPAGSTPDLLTFTPEMLTNAAAAGQVRVEDYPGRGAPHAGADPAAVLRVRPGRGRGRRHRRRPARRAGRRRRADVGGVAGLHRARACARSW